LLLLLVPHARLLSLFSVRLEVDNSFVLHGWNWINN